MLSTAEGESVGAFARTSIGAGVEISKGCGVGGSVGASVGAAVGCFKPKTKENEISLGKN